MTRPVAALLFGACAYAIAWAGRAPVRAAAVIALAVACLTWALNHH